MRIPLTILLSFTLKALFSPLSAQVLTDERNARYAEIVEACEYNRTCIDVKALELLALEKNPSCESKELFTTLLLLNRDMDSPYFLDEAISLKGCDTLFPSLRYNLGLSALSVQAFQRAEYHFFTGAMLPGNERKSAFLSAAGASAYQRGALEAAASHFQAAYYADSLSSSPMLLSNLSAVALEMNEPENAYEWGRLALGRYEDLEAEERMSLDDGGFLPLVNGNLLMASVALQDKSAAGYYFAECEFFENDYFSSEQKLKTWNDFLRVLDNSDYLKLYQDEIEAVIDAVDDSLLRSKANLDPMLFLLSSTATDYLVPGHRSDAWDFLAHLFPLPTERNEYTSAELSQAVTSDSRPWLWGVVIAVLLAMNAKLLWGLRKRRRTDSMLQGKRLALFQNMRRGMWDDEMREELVALLSTPAVPSTTRLPSTKELTRSQQVVLSEGIRGRYPKETAHAHGWSPQYVYQMRSEIRNALDIDANTSLESWADGHEELLKELLGAHFNPSETPDGNNSEDKNHE